MKVFLKPFFPTVTFFGIIFIILIDQLLKHKIRQNGGFYVCNEGISFNLAVSSFLFWLILAIFLIAGIIYFNHLQKNGFLKPMLILGFILFFGGALSNSIDRALFGCVFDYFAIFWKKFPLFNLADLAIFIGSCILILNNYTKKDSDRA